MDKIKNEGQDEPRQPALTLTNLIIGVRRLKLRDKLSPSEYRFFVELLLEANDVYPRFPKELILTNEQATDLCAGSVGTLQRIRESLAKKRIQGRALLKYEKGDRWTKRPTVYKITYALLLSCISSDNKASHDLGLKNEAKMEKRETPEPANNKASHDLGLKNEAKMKNLGLKNEALLDQEQEFKEDHHQEDPVSYEDHDSQNKLENDGGDFASLEKKQEAEEKKQEAEKALRTANVWPKIIPKFLVNYEPGYLLYKVAEFEKVLQEKTVTNDGAYLTEMIESGDEKEWLNVQEVEKAASAASSRESAIERLGDIVNEVYLKKRKHGYSAHEPYNNYDRDFRQILAAILDKDADPETSVRSYSQNLVDAGERAPEFLAKFREHFDHLVFE